MRRTLLFAVLMTALAAVACEQKAAPASSTTPDQLKADAPAQPAAQPDAPPAGQEAAASKEAAQADSTPILGLGKTPEDIKPGESHVYGARFTLMEEPISLASAIEKAAQGEGPYKVNATIQKVCQVKGCWFTLTSEGVKIPIRVKMKDYAFFVPRNAEGLPAVLEGTFKKVQIPQDEAQHYAEDEAKATGKPAQKIDGPQDTYQFMASAIQIDRPSGS